MNVVNRRGLFSQVFVSRAKGDVRKRSQFCVGARQSDGNKEWENLGARILKRFATTEQSPDGYWGEHNNSGPAKATII